MFLNGENNETMLFAMFRNRIRKTYNVSSKIELIQPNNFFRIKEVLVMKYRAARRVISAHQQMAVVSWSPLAGGRCAYPWEKKTARNALDEVVWSKADDIDKVVVDNLENISKELGYHT